MRFVPSSRQLGGLDRLNVATRPDGSLLPVSVTKLITEAEKLSTKHGEAVAAARELDAPEAEKAAKAADDDAAAAAARQGKPLPAPTNLPKLITDREQAHRAVTALGTALASVKFELDSASNAAAPDYATEKAARDAARARIEKAASDLADMVQAEVDRQALGGWLGGAPVSRNAVQTYAVDVLPMLGSRAMGRDPQSGVSVRDAIVNAATAALDPEGN